MASTFRQIVAAAILALVAGCSPMIKERGPVVQSPTMAADHFVMPDGFRLPIHTWPAQDRSPKAVIIALHGFNDYGHFFEDIGTYLSTRGVTSYAYDQRGFGATQTAGYWAGVDAYIADALSVYQVVRQKHPEQPVYFFGESMGAAVAMSVATSARAPDAAGYIVAAPAVWGRRTMPLYQRGALWLAKNTLPGLRLSAQGLKITPSDNTEMLRSLGRDPLVIKKTRVDALWGIVNLMDHALEGSKRFQANSLILYGAKDEIIRKKPTREMLLNLPEVEPGTRRIAVYENGYHMLIRDLMGETIWRDIESWIDDPRSPLPSGAEEKLEAFLEQSQ